MHTILGALLCLASVLAFPDLSPRYDAGNIGGGGGGGAVAVGGGGGGAVAVGGGGGGAVAVGGGGGAVAVGGGGGGAGVGGITFSDGCPAGQVMTGGSCQAAQITKNIYLYAGQEQAAVAASKAIIKANPKVNLNFVFVKTAGSVAASAPVVVPPPKQKTLVYVLNRRVAAGKGEVINLDSKPTKPQVYFVNYEEGDTADLPGGVTLQEALSQSVQQGQTIQGSAGSGGGAIGGGAIVDGGAIGGGAIIDGGAIGGGAIVDGGAIGGGAIIDGGAIGGGAIVDGGAIGGGAIVDGGAIGGGVIVDGGAIGGQAPSTSYRAPRNIYRPIRNTYQAPRNSRNIWQPRNSRMIWH